MKTLILVLVLLYPLKNFAESISFSIPSLDGTTHITGQIDKPNCSNKNSPAVLIVGGTGLFYRNGFFGKSKTERDFIFADLSQRFASSCLAVVRFDFRGITCDLTNKEKIKTCVDQNIRAGVTVDSILNDIKVVFDFAKTQDFIDRNKLFILAHSEGSINVSRLVARGDFNPAGILFIGGLTESPKSMIHWQMVNRSVDWFFEMDENKDGTLTNEEINANYSKSNFNGNTPLERLLSPSGNWTRDSLTAAMEEIYALQRSAILSKKDEDPYLSNGVVFASYQWWKSWFQDDISVLEKLKDFAGPIKYHNGDIDSQTPGIREESFLRSTQIKMATTPEFELHRGRGHGLSPDMLYGPIDEDIANEIVSDIFVWSNKH